MDAAAESTNTVGGKNERSELSREPLRCDFECIFRSLMLVTSLWHYLCILLCIVANT